MTGSLPLDTNPCEAITNVPIDDILGISGHVTIETYLHVGLNEWEMVHVWVVQG